MRRVLVVGPPSAGTTSVAVALRSRLPGYAVSEGAADSGDLMVLVVSAAAPMTRSQARLVDSHPGPVVAAVTKIDVHRCWRRVLEVNRALLPIRWVAVAAAPVIGPPRLEDLVGAVLAAPVRVAVRRQRGPDPTARIRLQQSRLESLAVIRSECAALRVELQAEAAAAARAGHFVRRARRRIAQAAAEIGAEITLQFGDSGGRPGPAAFPDQPPPRPAALEGRLATVLGVAFGAGAALTVGRLLADLAPGWVPVAAVGSGAAGLGLGLWVIRTRRLLAERAAADRWAIEAVAALRSALEEQVSGRVLAAEVTLLTSAPFGGCGPS